MSFIIGIHPQSQQVYRHTCMTYPEQEIAEQHRVYEIAAKHYWRVFKNNNCDYAIAAEFLRENLTAEQRDSEQFKHILDKRKPADC